MRRVRRRRREKLPPGARYVGRPTRWGNPFGMDLRPGDPRAEVVDLYRAWLAQQLRDEPLFLAPLRCAAALACWCPLDQPCHADVLIEFLQPDDEDKDAERRFTRPINPDPVSALAKHPPPEAER